MSRTTDGQAVKAEIASFFDPETKTITHVVKDPGSAACAIIDPVLDLDLKSGRTCNKSADRIVDYVKENDLDVEIFEQLHR